MSIKILTSEKMNEKVADIRSKDVVGVLKNALNYTDEHSVLHRPLFNAAAEEITELKATIVKLASKLANT